MATIVYNIASLLANRWKKAKEMNSVAQETYSSLTNSSSGIVLPSQLLLCADTLFFCQLLSTW